MLTRRLTQLNAAGIRIRLERLHESLQQSAASTSEYLKLRIRLEQRMSANASPQGLGRLAIELKRRQRLGDAYRRQGKMLFESLRALIDTRS